MVLLANIANFSNRTFLELIKTVYGVNRSRAMFISSGCGLSPFARVKKIPERTFRRVEAFILSKFKVGRDARQLLQANIKKLQNIHCYRALRMEQGLPAHGQRTRSNAKTAKKFGRVKNVYFRTDVYRFRSDDPRKNYIRKGKKNKPILVHSNVKYNNPAGNITSYRTNASNKKLPFLIRPPLTGNK